MIASIVIIALVVYFIHACFWPTMIFGGIAGWLEARLPEKLTQPLFNCPICMTPWWGAGIYLLLNRLQIAAFADARIQTIVVVLFAAAGLNTILLQVNRIANTINDWYEDQAEPSDN